MTDQFLTREEVTELTGSSTKVGQRQILAKNGINHIVRKDGWAMVTWHHVNHPATVEVELSGPDFGALMGSDAYA